MTFRVHKYRGDQWAWTLHAANGKKIGWMGEGHKRKAYVIKRVHKIILEASKAKLEILGGYSRYGP